MAGPDEGAVPEVAHRWLQLGPACYDVGLPCRSSIGRAGISSSAALAGPGLNRSPRSPVLNG